MAGLGIEIPKGSPGGIEAGAHALRAMAGSLERVQGQVAGSPGILGWQGVAFLGYEQCAALEAAAAGGVARAMHQGAVALVRAADTLEKEKAKAKRALADAREADRARARAEDRMQAAESRAGEARDAIEAASAAAALGDPGAGDRAGTAEAALFAAESDRAQASEEIGRAEDEIERCRSRANQAKEHWNDEAIRTGAELSGLAAWGSSLGASLATGVPRPAVGGGSPFALPGVPHLLSRADRRRIREEANEGGPLDDFADRVGEAARGVNDLWCPPTDYECTKPEAGYESAFGVAEGLTSFKVPVPRLRANRYGPPSATGVKNEKVEPIRWLRHKTGIKVNEQGRPHKAGKKVGEAVSTVRKPMTLLKILRRGAK